MIQEYFKGQAVGFLQFMREQGVMGLALGFILGTSVSKVVTSFSADIINPVLAIVLGSTDRIEALAIGSVRIGNFISNIIDFTIIAGVVYLLFKVLSLDKLDIKKL
ncbi:MAG: MscL family protein [Patescibacteria group bacterium]